MVLFARKVTYIFYFSCLKLYSEDIDVNFIYLFIFCGFISFEV